MDKKVEYTVSSRTVIRVILIVAGSLLAFRFVLNIAHVLQLVFYAFFLSLALNPAVTWISRKLALKRRISATGIAYLLVTLIISVLFALIVPTLLRQTFDFVKNAPQTVASINDESSWLGKTVKHYHLEAQVEGLSQNIRERTKNLQQPVVTTAGKIGSALISILTVFVLTFMMLVEGPTWISKMLDLYPTHKRSRYKKLAMQMYEVVTGYVNGQLVLALIGASFNFAALVIASTLLNVSINAVALAGILVFTGLIPMIGQLIGAVIIVTACLFVSLPLAIVMALFMLLYQQVENITLQPYIQSKFNELTPLIVFVAALLGVGFGGLLGAFIAIPLAGCIKIILSDYLERRTQ